MYHLSSLREEYDYLLQITLKVQRGPLPSPQNGGPNFEDMNSSEFGKKVHRKIEFRSATNPANGFQNGSQTVSCVKTVLRTGVNDVPSDGVSGPCPGLFDPAVVLRYMRWETITRVGPGLFNIGNTCFLNSTLQCLLHTPALTQILMKESKMALKGLERDENQQKTIIQLYQRYAIFLQFDAISICLS